MLLNVFYLYAVAWSAILVLYALQWSDLCIPLSAPVLLFVFFTIVVAGVLGYLMRNKLKFYKLEENPHKTKIATLVLGVFYLVDFLCARYVPLFAVISGESHTSQAFNGVPFLHVLMQGFSILYAFYLVYLFACFKKKSLILEFGLVFLYFFLMFQRQNMLVLLLGAMWILFASVEFKTIRKRSAVLICFGGVIAMFVVLYLFGAVGNVRYGSAWKWNDPSMICELGRINDRWPSFLSKMYAWAYSYLISPLSNLQYNYLAGVQSDASAWDVIWQFIPRYITRYLPYVSGIQLELLEPSLFVCTAFAAIYRALGVFGMYALYFAEIAIILVVVRVTEKRKEHFVVYCVGLFYFFMMNFFDNPIVYEITSFMFVYPVLYEIWLFLKRRVVIYIANKRNKAVSSVTQEENSEHTAQIMQDQE